MVNGGSFGGSRDGLERPPRTGRNGWLVVEKWGDLWCDPAGVLG